MILESCLRGTLEMKKLSAHIPCIDLWVKLTVSDDHFPLLPGQVFIMIIHSVSVSLTLNLMTLGICVDKSSRSC